MSSIATQFPAAVAVSGGSDSIALMHLLARWARKHGAPMPLVVTVDHKLRRGSSTDAKGVAKEARAVGLEAHLLTWKGEKPKRNIEAKAREARYRLIGDWCKERKIATVYVGHTLDDQAETFLLRLARGSGIDGLAAMAPVSRWPVAGYPGLGLVRPLLGIERATLRDFLVALGISWVEDPMNLQQRFSRSRVRSVWPTLHDIGLTKVRLVETAVHISRARAALELATNELICRSSRPFARGIAIDWQALASAPREIGLRVLAELLMRVGGAVYRPRFERLERLFDALISESPCSGRTLHGCRAERRGEESGPFGSRTIVIQPERLTETKGVPQP